MRPITDKMATWRALSALVVFQVIAFSFPGFGEDVISDKNGTRYSLLWDDSSHAGAAEQLFVETFYNLYKDSPQVDITDKRAWLKETFQEDMDAIRAHPEKYRWVVARNQNTGAVEGFASFDVSRAGEIYVMQMAVDPALQGQGMGRQLLFSILGEFSHASQMVLITRRMNTDTIAFYSKFGFKESEFMREGYDPKKYIGMSLEIPPGKCPEFFARSRVIGSG